MLTNPNIAGRRLPYREICCERVPTVVRCWHNSLKWLPTSVRRASRVLCGCCGRIDSPPPWLGAIEDLGSWECLSPCGALMRVTLIRVRGRRSAPAPVQKSFNWYRVDCLRLRHYSCRSRNASNKVLSPVLKPDLDSCDQSTNHSNKK